MEKTILENYHDRLKEVLDVSGKLDENDLSYCKLLAIDEFKHKKNQELAKQTATEWLFEQLWNTDKDKFIWYGLLKQAEEMFEQQIMDAYRVGKVEATLPSEKLTTGEQYYQETFKSE